MKNVKQKMEYAEYASIGIEFVISPFIGYGIGHYLDKWLHTAPVFTYIFSAAGIISPFRSAYRMAKRLEKTIDDENGGDE